MIWEAPMTREEAILLAATEWWKGRTAQEIVDVQLFLDRSVMPFDLYHEALEEVLQRPIQTLEFTKDGVKRLQREYIMKCQRITADETK